MGGVFNVLLGALLAGASWFGPQYASDDIAAVSPLLLDYADAGVIAGGVIAAVGVLELVWGVITGIFSALTSRKEIVLSEEEVDNLFSRLTVAMAVADETISDHEIEIVISQNLQRRNIHLTAPDVRELAADPKKLRSSVLKEVKRRERGLSWDAKRQMVETLEWILRSDFRVHDGEIKFVKDVANAMRLDPQRRDAIAKSVEERHHSALKLAASGAAVAAPAPTPEPAPEPAPAPTPEPAPNGGDDAGRDDDTPPTTA